MTSEQIAKVITDDIAPKLEELGIEGFVMSGYRVDNDGVLRKFTVCQSNKNVAIEDGLQPLVAFGQVWGSAPRRPAAPQDLPPDDPDGG